MTPNPISVEDHGGELRRLPSVERLAGSLGDLPHGLAVRAAREEIGLARAAVRAGEAAPSEGELAAAAIRRAGRLARPGPRRVINATGVVLHTNLGRAPLSAAAARAVAEVAGGYSDLEYDLESGRRGSRMQHVEGLLRDLAGSAAALAVNNNAAAVMLALAALAGDGEVLIGRGELVEIGGSFRIPEILAASGARMVEVGTTNRTRVGDYERAIGPRTTAILRVHPSNFRIVGFAERPEAAELFELAREHGLAAIDDLGSGALEPIGDEPTIRAALATGADLVCCSGDKLLGGPQAGLLLGGVEAVERCRGHPLARALRIDKLQLAALSATLIAHRDEGPGGLPVSEMIDAPEELLRERADSMAARIGPAAGVVPGAGAPGGGSLADLTLPGPVCAVEPGELGADGLAATLREAEPPVVARIGDGRVILDPRTMTAQDAELAAAAARAALG